MSNITLLAVATVIILGIALGLDPKTYLLVAIYLLLLGIFVNAPPPLLLAYLVISGVWLYIHYKENRNTTEKLKEPNIWDKLLNFADDFSLGESFRSLAARRHLHPIIHTYHPIVSQ